MRVCVCAFSHLARLRYNTSVASLPPLSPVDGGAAAGGGRLVDVVLLPYGATDLRIAEVRADDGVSIAT